MPAKGIVSKAKGLFGKRYAAFLDNLQAYKYFPLAICKGINDVSGGTITVKFKAIHGRIHQAAGMVLFTMERGKRSSGQWIRNVKTPTNTWHNLKVVIKGKNIKGFLNGKLFINYNWKEEISKKIGLWSKADSYVFFDDFKIQQE